MPNKTPKFAELLTNYQEALDLRDDAAKSLTKAMDESDKAEKGLDVARLNLTSAMKQFGINSIREFSFSEEYLFLNADGQLETRKLHTAADADREAKKANAA